MDATLATRNPRTSQKEPKLLLSSKAARSLIQLRRIIEKISDVNEIVPLLRSLGRWYRRETATAPLDNQHLNLGKLSQPEVENLAASIILFLSDVGRSPLSPAAKREAIRRELESCKFPTSFTSCFLDSVFAESTSLAKTHQLLVLPNFHRFVAMRWRLDVLIVNHLGKKLLEPQFQLALKTSRKSHVFEVSATQFHKLRFAVASLLLELQALDSINALSAQ